MPRQPKPLYLHEEIMLLALRDEKGTVELGSMYGYALGGAILAELLLEGRIAVEEGKKKLINLVSDQIFGEPVIDECLQKIVTAKRRANPQSWVQRFASLKKLHHRIALGLCDRGILRADEGKVLLIFSRKIYPEINPQPERRLIERLRKVIFGESPRVDSRTTILLSLAKSAGLLNIPFDKRELKRRKKRYLFCKEGSSRARGAQPNCLQSGGSGFAEPLPLPRGPKSWGSIGFAGFFPYC